MQADLYVKLVIEKSFQTFKGVTSIKKATTEGY